MQGWRNDIGQYRNDIGQYHREDGPARVWIDGSQQWFINGKQHRIDGPADIDGTDNTQEWWVNDKDITIEVQSWMKENDIPSDYTEWSDIHRVLFRLRF